jgi:hypothetical protein
MQDKYPQVFKKDEPLFGNDGGQHNLGQKLMTCFDDDPNRPMKCEVRGSKWIREFDGMNPVFVVKVGNELAQIPLVSAHEESGWKKGWTYRHRRGLAKILCCNKSSDLNGCAGFCMSLLDPAITYQNKDNEVITV